MVIISGVEDVRSLGLVYFYKMKKEGVMKQDAKKKVPAVRIKFSSLKSLHNMLKQLRSSGVRFSTEDTSGSFKIRVPGEKRARGVSMPDRVYEYNSPGDLQSMGVFMKLRKEILSRRACGKSPRKLKVYSPSDLKYWKLGDLASFSGSLSGFSGGEGVKQMLNSTLNPAKTGKKAGKKNSMKLPRVVNIDIKKAYPWAFYNLGFIGKPVLKYLLDLDASGKKISRLKGMGVLAKRKLVNNYSAGKLRNSEIRDDEYLRACFFNACKVIDDVMLECCEAAGKDLLFMWVDGIYINAKYKRSRVVLKRISRLIQKSGYKYTREMLRDFQCGIQGDERKPILAISFRKRGSKRDKITRRRKWGKKPKTFTLPLNSGLVHRID